MGGEVEWGRRGAPSSALLGRGARGGRRRIMVAAAGGGGGGGGDGGGEGGLHEGWLHSTDECNKPQKGGE